jgi:hypothetical protein
LAHTSAASPTCPGTNTRGSVRDIRCLVTHGRTRITRWLYSSMRIPVHPELRWNSCLAIQSACCGSFPSLKRRDRSPSIKAANIWYPVCHPIVGNKHDNYVAPCRMFQPLTHVPFRAAGDLVTALIRGDIQASFQLVPNIQGQLSSAHIHLALNVPVEEPSTASQPDQVRCRKSIMWISSSGSARDNQHLSYPWIVSPRSSMATNSAILRALVSAFLTLPIRYRIA